MAAVDELNRKSGCGTVVFAGSGLKREWLTKREQRLPRHTTDPNRLFTVAAG